MGMHGRRFNMELGVRSEECEKVGGARVFSAFSHSSLLFAHSSPFWPFFTRARGCAAS